MLTEARMFLETLFTGKPDELYLLLCFTDDEEPLWFTDLEAAIDCAEPISECDVFVGVGLAKQKFGPGLRCPSEDVAGIVGVFANISLRSDAHPRDTLPRTVEQALTILPAEMPPSFVIFTGDGIQALWLFPETWVFENDDERCRAATLISRWNILLKENAGQRGWTFERATELSAILRVPGSLNCKNEATPTRVTLHAQNDCRYIPADMIQYLDDLAVPDPATERPPESELAERAESAPLTINLSARVPEEHLNAWMAADLRFKNTWFRQRHDFQDQAQTKYDLALASFGFGVGCTNQEIVDLILHHRSIHRQKARTTPDYFQRILSNADKSSSGKVLNTSNGVTTAPAPTPPTELGAPELSAERSRIALCRELSAALEVDVLRIVKLTGQIPSYRLELARGKVEFPNVSKLINQNAVRDGIAGVTDALMPRFKSNEWRRVAQKLLSACVEIQSGDELFNEGAARFYIGHYLDDVGFIPSIEDQPLNRKRQPMVRTGRITICLFDLQAHIHKTMMQNLPPQKLANLMSTLGAKSVRIRAKKRDQYRWELPVEEFDPADYEFPKTENSNDIDE